jgi:hypothetical protein
MATTPLRSFGYSGRSPYGDDEDEQDALLSLLDQQRPQGAVVQLPEVAVRSGQNYDPDIMGEFEPAPAAEPEDQLTARTMLEEPRAQLGPASSSAAASGMQQLLPQQDPELAAKQRQVQLQALDEAGTDSSKYGLGEFARDNGAALLASILDIGFNKGRGLGGIVSATAGEVGKQEAARQQKRKEARDFALRSRGKQTDPFEQALKAQMLGIHAGNLEARNQQLSNTQQRYDTTRGDKSNPDSAVNTTAVEVGGRKAETNAERRILKQAELSDVAASDKANIAGAQAGARTKAETEELRSNPRELTTQQQVENARATDTRRTGEIDRYQKDIGNMVEVAKAARQLQTLFAASPNDLPGVGVWDSSKPAFSRSKADQDAATQLAQLRSFVQNPITGAATGGPREEKRISELAGDAQGMTESQAQNAINNLAEIANSRLKSYAVGREDIARQVLQQHGLDDLIGGAAPAAAPNPAAIAAPPGAGMPGWNRMGIEDAPNLGDTGRTRSQVPSIDALRQPMPEARGATQPPPGFDAGGNEVHHVRKPDGSVVETRKPIDQLRSLPSGWELVD